MTDRRWDTVLVADHEVIERAMDVLRRQLADVGAGKHDLITLRRAIDFLLEFGDRVHNQKEEQYLFPLLVERGIPESGPIRVMLLEHEAERSLLAGMYDEAAALSAVTADVRDDYWRRGQEYLTIRAEHIWKENDVLYAMGRRAFTPEDNGHLLGQFDALAAAAFGDDAEAQFARMLQEVEQDAGARRSLIHNLTMDQIHAIMETLPVEVTFVDANDTVAYFNRLDREKVFVRSRSVVGRKVQKCHPAGSVERVLQIVNGFKDGSLDGAEFWIDFAGDKVMIRYFPVRNENGTYLGTLEVTQKIGAIQKITGEKRLLQ